MALIIANNAESALASSLGGLGSNRTLVIRTLDVAKFPAINPGGVGSDYGLMTLEDAAGNREIVSIARHDAGSATFTVDRGQEGTTIRAWALDDMVAMRLTAGIVNLAFSHPSQNTGAHQASAIAFTPAGSVAATNVQAAIAELDTEKLQGSNSLNAIRVLTPIADAIAYFTGAATASLTSLTAFGRTLIGAADAAEARTAMGAQVAGSYQAAGSGAGITSLPNLTAGGLPDNSILTDDIAALQVTGAKIAAATITPDKLSGAQTGSAPVYGARAWCVFNGTTAGTNAPTAGGNVTNVARAGTGTYTINFTTAMPDANYAVLATPLASALATPRHIAYNTKNTTSVVIYTTDTAGAAADPTDISIVILR